MIPHQTDRTLRPIRRRTERKLAVPALAICATISVPLVALVVLAFGDTRGVWLHLVSNVLPSSIMASAGLMAGVGVAASAIGVGAAWLVSRYRFFGRSVLQWALILPLAVPTYLSAYCFVELLDYTGPVQAFYRSLGGFRSPADYWFPDIRSLPGAIAVMSVVLYPYVYLTCRIVFAMQAASVLDASRILGAGVARQFFGVAVPLARPAIAAGATLAMLEAFNDIGAVEILGVRTLTFSVFDTWLNRASLAGAAQIACLMLIVVFALIVAERAARGGRSYQTAGGGTLSLIDPGRAAGVVMALFCLLPILAGFVAPVGLLMRFALRRTEQLYDPALAAAAFNSVFVSSATAILTVTASFVLIVSARRHRGRSSRIASRGATFGYAIPGSVLAIGTLYAFTTFDNSLDSVLRRQFGVSSGLLISGGAAIIVYACSVRFLAIAHGALESGYSRISEHLGMVARTLGRTANQAVVLVELPLLKRAIATAALLVFVDTMKELSATVLLRPFGFQTLATFVYERASRALFEDAAIAALVIVAIGVAPAILVNRVQLANRPFFAKKEAGPRPASS
jgi:iron(III) transport system permease protein